ncbi:terminase large subunit domain-containing protein, partial [Sphingomonas bacterium]|uniref:terminase large subunit domain-containing protein n=1 Tax=Sphingomonas bacterium TaxID=1895847 RepID=UPI0015764C1A
MQTLLSMLESWAMTMRVAQAPPEGDWRTWLIMAGRGYGKTRAGAEWVRERAENDGRVRIALVAATLAEARAVMVEGETGLLAIAPDDNRPRFEPSNRKLIWRDGAQATLYSAGEPESLRGPQHHFAWCDEIGKWARGQEVWDNLAMGLRLGSDPRTVATSTPRAVPLVRKLAALATEDGPVRMTRGRMIDNRAHLATAFIETMEASYGGTTIGRQELDGELIEEIEGALWSRALIERCRVAAAPAAVRVVIGVDPPAGADATSDACGIVVVALGEDARAYVIADASVKGASPEGW